MSLLDKLWDDTLAGPRPETGLGRLRKPAALGLPQRSGKEMAAEGGAAAAAATAAEIEAAPTVTRSIMIKRPAGSPSSGTPPSSPAGSTPPVSPFSGGKEWNRFRRKSLSAAYERGGGGSGGSVVGFGPRTPTPPHEV